jgi:hypothetical protein
MHNVDHETQTLQALQASDFMVTDTESSALNDIAELHRDVDAIQDEVDELHSIATQSQSFANIIDCCMAIYNQQQRRINDLASRFAVDLVPHPQQQPEQPSAQHLDVTNIEQQQPEQHARSSIGDGVLIDTEQASTPINTGTTDSTTPSPSSSYVVGITKHIVLHC